jgi:predicted  nucleic acid-binding Zn-ribbon protein
MEPVAMEMNANVFMAIGCVIGMIGFISWGIVKNFEENLLTNSGRHTKEEIDNTVEEDNNTEEELDSSLQEKELDDLIADGEEAPVEQVTMVEEDQTIEDLHNEINALRQGPVEEDQTIEDLNNEINAWRQIPTIDGWNVPAIEVEEAPANDSLKQIRTDVDSLHERFEEVGHNMEVTHNLVTQISESVTSINDNTVATLSQKITTLQASLAKEFKVLTDTQSSLSDSLMESKLTIGSLLARPPADYVTHATLSTYATLDSINFMKKMMTDEFRTSLAEYVPLRDLTTLKVQLDEIARRGTVQKTIYQAWNGSAEWSDFNEGKLNIQMIRKKFMTTEQNEEWLLPENKKIAAYNRDQLLGLDDQTWETKDNQVFVKRYYKDDWDASVEVAITVTLSKKIMVPPGGKSEVTMSHILRKLSESEKIQWEHLLVNV